MEPFDRTIDAAKKYVVSSTLERVDWNAELVRGDLGKAVQQLKQEPGKGLFVAGVKLPLALAELGHRRLRPILQALTHRRLAKSDTSRNLQHRPLTVPAILPDVPIPGWSPPTSHPVLPTFHNPQPKERSVEQRG